MYLLHAMSFECQPATSSGVHIEETPLCSDAGRIAHSELWFPELQHDF